MSDIKLDGDAAVVGGIHSDSHNVQTTNISNTNTTNNSTVNNKTVYEAQRTQAEIYQDNERQFLNAVQERMSDGILDQRELAELNLIAQQWMVSAQRASQIIEQVRRSAAVLTGGQGNEFLTSQIVTEVFNAVQAHEVDILKHKFRTLEQVARTSMDGNVQFYYHLLLASLYPENCTVAFINSHSDNYWQLFFAHIAYVKLGNVDNAAVLLPRLGGFGCPQGDIALLMAIDSLAEYCRQGKRDYYRQQAQQYLDQACQLGMSEQLSGLWYGAQALLQDPPQTEDWYLFYVDTTLQELGTPKVPDLPKMAKPQAPAPPPMPKFNAQNVNLAQMQGFNPLQAAKQMGFGGAMTQMDNLPQMGTMPQMPTAAPAPPTFPNGGTLQMPQGKAMSKSVDEPDPLEDHYGIILTNSGRLSEKYHCTWQKALDVLNDFIQKSYDQQMYWYFCDAAMYPDELRNGDLWLDYNALVSNFIAENNLQTGPDLHLLIIGGADVIPIPNVDNPYEHTCGQIPSDMAYAFEGSYIIDLLDGNIADIEAGYARNNVARLPLEDGDMETSIEDDLGVYFQISANHAGGIPVGNVVMSSNAEWIPASATMTEHLPLLCATDNPQLTKDKMYISPDVLTSDENTLEPYCKALDKADLLMFNLHGADAPDMPGFYSTDEAFNPKLLYDSHALVLNTVACFGARFTGYERDQSMLLTALYGAGMLLYTGSLISVPMYYNEDNNEARELLLNPGTGSEVLMRLYTLYQFKGMTMGRALLQAKCDYFNLCRHVESDGFSLSTILMFSLYGNPMLHVRSVPQVVESALANDAIPPAPVKGCGQPVRKTLTQRIMSKDAQSQSLLEQVRGYVDNNLAAIRQMVEQHLYNALGLPPRLLESIDQYSRPQADGSYEVGYSFNYHDPDKRYAADTYAEVSATGQVKRIYTTK